MDQLQVRVFTNRAMCGLAAAHHVAERLHDVVLANGSVAVAFSAAPSQNEFFAALIESDRIDWDKVTAYHIDEYVGVGLEDPRVLRHYLERRLFSRRKPARKEYLAPDAPFPAAEARRYAGLLRERPIEVSCLGIGESCHLAYNDPHVAKFDDPELVKVIEIDDTSMMQQVHDHTAQSLADALRRAYTLTIPALMRAKLISCVAPGKVKAKAVARTLTEPIGEHCPSTVLRTHPSAVLFLDIESAAEL